MQRVLRLRKRLRQQPALFAWLLVGAVGVGACAEPQGVVKNTQSQASDADKAAGELSQDGAQTEAPTGNSDDGPIRALSLSKSEQRRIVEGILAKLEEAASCQPTAGLQILRRLTNAEYRATVTDLLGDQAAGKLVDGFPPQTLDQGFDNNAYLNLVGKDQLNFYWQAAEALGQIAAERLDRLVSCSKKDEACARKFISDFGLKVYRRPLAAAEQTALLAVYQAGAAADFNSGLSAVAMALFNSPHFLYRAELGVKQDDGTFALSSYEVVTALSYQFFGTTPSDKLLAKAASKAVLSASEVESLALELLADAKSAVGLGHFADAYMRVPNVFSVSIPPAQFPEFTPEVREAMAKETRDFISLTVREADGSFADLFHSPFTYIQNAKLQDIYGGQSAGDETGKGRFNYDSKRLGLLGHGSFLAGHTHGETTSPVLRGAFVLENLLCDIPLPPPPELQVQPPKLDPNLTTQERFKAHSQQAACAACHVKIDGIGFGLEAYDPIGRFRSKENNRAIDSQGVVYLDDGQPRNFSGSQELGKHLATSTRARACFALQLMRHSNGRPIYEADSCQAKKLIQTVDNDDKLKKLFASVFASYSFLHRQP